jgi:hypothetical protein
MYRIAGATSSGPSSSGRSSAAGGHRLTPVAGAAILAVFATIYLILHSSQKRDAPTVSDQVEQAPSEHAEPLYEAKLAIARFWARNTWLVIPHQGWEDRRGALSRAALDSAAGV